MDIYVANLPYSATEQDLSELFSAFGPVKRTTIVKDRETGRSKGFGFVALADESQVQPAIEAINGSEMQGRVIKANASEPKPNFNKGKDRSGTQIGTFREKGSGAASGRRDFPNKFNDSDYGDDGHRQKRAIKPKGSQKGRRRHKGGYDEEW